MENGKHISAREFVCAAGGKKAFLGLDLGEKTIGVAVSDLSGLVATPLQTVRRKNFAADMAELKKTIGGRPLGGIVSGLPLEMDGTEGERAVSTRFLAQKIADYFQLPLFFQDERLSSKAVERFMIDEGDFSRKKRGKLIDNAAAAFILQGFLDAAR